MIISPKLKYLTDKQVIELAKVLCSSKSSIQEDYNKIFQSMLERGFSENEATKIIKVFNDKIAYDQEINIENSCSMYNIDGFNQITYLIVNYILAANNSPIIGHFYDQNTIKLVEEDLNQNVNSSIEEAIESLIKNRICFINNNLIHPYSENLCTENKEALLVKSLIKISNTSYCIIYCPNKNIANLALKSAIEIEFEKIMTISKGNEENILYCQIYENSMQRNLEINSLNYGVKLTKNKLIEANECQSIIQSIFIGYNSIYRGEINLLTSLALYFTGKATDFNEGIHITQSIFENNKITKLIENIKK